MHLPREREATRPGAVNSAAGPNSPHRKRPMQQATLPLPSTPDLSKPGLDARTLWRLSYRQSRAQVRKAGRFGIGERYAHCLDHMRRRWGPSGWPIAQAAARTVLEVRTPGHAASGTVADLWRQGWVNARGEPTRACSVEKLTGWRMAWSADPLASVNGNRMLRARLARLRREEKARMRRTAALLAPDRLRIEAEGPYFALTVRPRPRGEPAAEDPVPAATSGAGRRTAQGGRRRCAYVGELA
jgi:hypothetical protein